MSPIQDSEYKALKPKPGHMALEALPRVPDRPRQPWALPRTALEALPKVLAKAWAEALTEAPWPCPGWPRRWPMPWPKLHGESLDRVDRLEPRILMSPIQDSEYKTLKPKPGHMALEALPRVPDKPRQPRALPKTAQDEPKRSSGQSQELLWLPGMAHHECLGVDLDCLDMTHVGALRPQEI